MLLGVISALFRFELDFTEPETSGPGCLGCWVGVEVEWSKERKLKNLKKSFSPFTLLKLHPLPRPTAFTLDLSINERVYLTAKGRGEGLIHIHVTMDKPLYRRYTGR